MHARVDHRVLLCNEIQTVFAIRPFSPSRVIAWRAEATACLRSRRHGMTAPCGHAMTGGFEAGDSIHEVEAAPVSFIISCVRLPHAGTVGLMSCMALVWPSS